MYRRLCALLVLTGLAGAPVPAISQDTGAQAIAAPDTPDQHESAPADAPEAGTTPVSGAIADPSSATQPAAAQPEPSQPAPTPRRPEDITLRVATWAGSYEQAQRRAVFDDFAARTRYQLSIMTRAPGEAELGAAGATPDWDVADVSAASAERGCRDGVLERIDVSFLAPGVEGDPAMTDFLPGALRDCAVASSAWSSVIVYDRRAFARNAPEMLADFFDIERFPGKRVLPRGPRFLLELALRADGVAPIDIYPALSTPDGQARAFAKLEAIGDYIVWVETAADTLDLLGVGEITMALAFNGRAFSQITSARAPLGIIWDGQLYAMNYWVIARGTDNVEQARELVASATLPETMAAQTRWLPYGPVRKSALPMVGKHAELNVDMAEFVPTMPQNFNGAMAFDARWWAGQDGMLEKQFADWLALQDEKRAPPTVPEPAQRARGG